MKSIQEFGVLPQNSPQTNAENLQKAIDWATQSGAALWVEPTEDGYPVASGIVLKENVSLIGVHGPTGRGTGHPKKNAPTGSLFLISDEKAPFITVESATQIRGIQFWYPQQAYQDKDKIIPYPPTIQMSQDRTAQGVTLSCLTFYGEYIAMDFNGRPDNICEQILFEHCYGYPLSGEFIRIDYCYDIPRILHCHVNPSNMRMFGRAFSKEVVDAVIAQPTYTFSINHTDNAQLIDLFTFGAHGGIYLGEHTYGQLTNFNLDCVTVGIYKNDHCQRKRVRYGDTSHYHYRRGTYGHFKRRGFFRHQRGVDSRRIFRRLPAYYRRQTLDRLPVRVPDAKLPGGESSYHPKSAGSRAGSSLCR